MLLGKIPYLTSCLNFLLNVFSALERIFKLKSLNNFTAAGAVPCGAIKCVLALPACFLKAR